MRLCDLVTDAKSDDPRFASLAIAGLAADSRAVKPGFLFVAVAGSRADGLAYVAQAVAAGAVAIMAERRPDRLPDHVAFVSVPNARRALALAAAKFYPRQPATIAAVTGTSGKTSVAYFTRQIWERLGHCAAALGTLGVVTAAGTAYGSLTTPDPVSLHATIDRLAGEGITHLAMEASSHGLDQYRLDGVHVDAAAFTNLSRDHLDYHPDLDAYLRAKLRLFSHLVVPGGAAVVAADHDAAAIVLDVARRRGLRILSVGRNGDGIRLLDVTIDRHAQNLALAYEGRRRDVRLPLVGAFQVENALVAAGLALATGGDEEAVFGALASLRGAKGRLELVAQTGGAAIFVDYAHKPDALAKALEALRPYAKGRLAVVFGAGGDRDHGKRPVMGAIAKERADLVVVTDDNPRSEDPASIRRAILAAAPGAIEIGDRGEAIRWAIGEMRSGDILLIAGKGHETGQIVGDRVLPFSDHDAVAAALGDKVA
jgi:UDP-N-acetylmuramoyl-L-alanyl-D-glutamate--2,6-diaminopimelate ligase